MTDGNPTSDAGGAGGPGTVEASAASERGTAASAASGPLPVSPALVLELFVTVNFAVLVADVWVAHSFNEFAHQVEWVPLIFSAVAALLLGGNLLVARPWSEEGRPFHRGAGRTLGILVGAASILVGVSGLVLHLDAHFFEELTLSSLVYSAPFVAPLAYAGLGFLVLLNRMVPTDGTEWPAWILLLACGGFFGNFALSVVDHAQNGFFYATEWIPVVVAALATGHLVAALVRTPDRRFLDICWAVLALSVLTGLVGFWFHLDPILEEAGRPVAYRVIYGAPIFAPLLFPNIAALAGIGVWDLQVKLSHGGAGSV